MKFNLVCVYAIILNKPQHVEFSGSNSGCNACFRKRFLLEKHWYISMWSRLNWFERFHNLQVTVNQIQVEFCVRHHSRTRSDWTNWGYLIDHQVRRVKWVWPNPSIYTHLDSAGLPNSDDFLSRVKFSAHSSVYFFLVILFLPGRKLYFWLFLFCICSRRPSRRGESKTEILGTSSGLHC